MNEEHFATVLSFISFFSKSEGDAGVFSSLLTLENEIRRMRFHVVCKSLCAERDGEKVNRKTVKKRAL